MLRNFFLLKLAFVLVVILVGLNYLAGVFYLYWTLGWYDYLVHFVGGASMATLVAWFVSHGEYSGAKTVVIILLFTMAVGGAWEIFEYLNDIAYATEGYALDTTHDLLMDALGALIVSLLYIRTSKDGRD